MSQLPEDAPPLTPATPVLDELQQLPSERKTLIPPAEVNAHLIALSLNEMTGTMRTIAESVAPVSDLAAAVKSLQNQHDVTLQKLDNIAGTATLAGNIATLAKEAAEGAQEQAANTNRALDRMEGIMQRMALSLSGINERTKSLYDAVFPEREGNGHDPEIEIEGHGELVPFRRAADGD